jgi:hypothetical protein
VIQPAQLTASVAVGEVDVSRLRVHRNIQRKFIPAWGDYLRDNWNPLGAGVLSAIGYDDGTQAIFDGQHRLYAMRGNHVVLAMVMTFLGLTDDAAAAMIQRLVGNQKRWHPIDNWHMRLKSHEPTAAAMNKILEANGGKINWHSTDGYACVGQLETIFKWADVKRDVLGPELLAKTIYTIENAWAIQGAHARSAVVVRAVGFFYFSYPNANPKLVTERFATLSLGPTMTTAKARLYEGDSFSAELTKALLHHYNKTIVGPKFTSKLRLPRGYRMPS